MAQRVTSDAMAPPGGASTQTHALPHAKSDVAMASSACLPRVSSNGAFVSARDSKFWLAVAVASTSGANSSFSSNASSSGHGSLSGSFLSLHSHASALDVRALLPQRDAGDPNPSSKLAPVARGSGTGDRHLGLSIDIDDDEDDDDDREDTVAPVTSPPPPLEGMRRPTKLQNHRNRDHLGSDWRSSTSSNGSHATTQELRSPPLRPASQPQEKSPVKAMPSPVVLPMNEPETTPQYPTRAHTLKTDVSFELAVEEVYEHQRYQMVLGWGSKGHLLPLDPAKFVRVVRVPLSQQQQRLHDHRRRRPSLSSAFADPSLDVFPSATFPDLPLPDTAADEAYKWEWISPWHLEYPVCTGEDVDADADQPQEAADADGWMYASSFSHFTSWRNDSSSSIDSVSNDNVCTSPMVNSRGRPKLNVRRRKWIRYRRRRPVAMPSPTTHAEAFALQLAATSSPFDDSFLDSMCGWLRKLGHVRKNWKMRYFVLEKSVLRYYADEAMTRLKGEVLLFHPATRVHYVDIHLSDGRDDTFAVQVGPEYALLLQAERLSDRENWMYCVEDALLCRDSYLQDPARAQDVRESVARRRNFSSESMLFSITSTDTATSASLNPVNMLMLHSKAVVQATRKNPLMMRLMMECDVWIESKQLKQQIATFITKFKQKYGNAACASNSSSSAPSSASSLLSKTMSPLSLSSVSSANGNRRRTSSYEGVETTRLSDVSVIQDPRSLLALKNYRFFLERTMADTMDHLNRLPLVNASVEVTSPKSAKTAEDRPSDNPPLSGDLDWELAKKAALYKLERQTFIPLQDIIYGLLETTVASEDLDRFERNRCYLAMQSQRFFEIQESHLSPSDWKSARLLLDTMDNYSLPTEKASILLEVAKCIYDTYAREHNAATSELQMMAADDFLPIFIFVLARSKLRNVVVARHLVSETMISCVMIGETGYYATMFEAAVSYIASFFIGDDAPLNRRLSRSTATVSDLLSQ